MSSPVEGSVASEREMQLFERLLEEAGVQVDPLAQLLHGQRVFQIAFAILAIRARKAGDLPQVGELTRTKHFLKRRMHISDIQELQEFLERVADGHRQEGLGPVTLKTMEEVLAVAVSEKRKRR